MEQRYIQTRFEYEISLYLLFESQFLTNFGMSDFVYIFLDESGNLDFTSDGSKYFLLTSVSMKRPFNLLRLIDDYKHDFLESGKKLEFFHCTDDRYEVKSEVFEIIAKQVNDLRINCLIIEKAGTSLSFRDDTKFYPSLLKHLLNIVLLDELHIGVQDVVVITDTLPSRRRNRKLVEKSVRMTLTNRLPPGVSYQVLHHQSRSHYGLQVADYCCWALHKKWQMGTTSWYNKIQPAIRNEVVFQKFPPVGKD